MVSHRELVTIMWIIAVTKNLRVSGITVSNENNKYYQNTKLSTVSEELS